MPQDLLQRRSAGAPSTSHSRSFPGNAAPEPATAFAGSCTASSPSAQSFLPDPCIKDTGQPPSPSLPHRFLLPLKSWLLTSFLAGKLFLLSSLPIACFHMFPVLLCSVCDWRVRAPVHVRWGSSEPAPHSPPVARHACHLTATQRAPCPHPAPRSTCRRVPSSGRDLPPKPLAETHTQLCRNHSPQPCAWLCPQPDGAPSNHRCAQLNAPSS